ncbi:MAG: transporter substrate-binding domain-containing protein [Burkholderiales bacterium]|nr:transporter substrate-binding domain-containing protein [Burkholderiales bacterium]
MEPLHLGLLVCAATMGGRAGSPELPGAATLRELAPTGTLRFGVVTAPERTSFFVVKGAQGNPSGVPADLGRALARRAGLPIEFLVAPNSGIVTDALSTGAIDASFMPVDEERSKRVDFGPVYFVFENTYLVRAGSDIQSIADVDRAGVRVIGIAGTTTIRTSSRLLTKTTVTPVPAVDEALEMLVAGTADAFALTRDSLTPLAARVPGARVLDGAFHRTGIGIAVPKNRPDALAYVSAFLEEAKSSGMVRRAFDDAGLKDLAVAPARE